MKRIILVWVFASLLSPLVVMADSICNKVRGDERQRLDKLLKEIKLYDCCDESVDACLKKEKVCKLANRIKEEICLLINNKYKDEDIKKEIDARGRSMSTQLKKPEFELDEAFLAGDKGSKISIVLYICARCPFCAVVTPKLYREIVDGRLKGKAKLYVRPFPLKSHEYSVEGALAMVAASKFEKFYDYLLMLYEDFINFSPAKLNIYAKSVDIDIEKFQKTLKEEKIRKYVEVSKKEGLKNGVEATPTFFINGKRYYANYYVDLLVDAILEEYDRVTNDIYIK